MIKDFLVARIEMLTKQNDPGAVYERVDTKVKNIFRRLAGRRAERLRGDRFQLGVLRIIDGAYRRQIRSKTKRRDFAHHMVEWNQEAAYMVAFLLYPERFTTEEVWALVFRIVIHAPDHLAAAAKLEGHPVTDVFEVGAIDGDPELDRIQKNMERRMKRRDQTRKKKRK